MKNAVQRRDWLWASLGAVVLTGAVLVLFRAPRAAAPPISGQRGVSVRLGASAALQEEAAIFDPKLLFLPTAHNAAPPAIKLREPGSAFPDYLPKLGFDEAVLKLDSLALPKPVQVPPDPAVAPGAVLALPAPGPLAMGFGRTEAPVQPLSGRGAFVEIMTASTGQQVLVRRLAESARPAGNSSWQPLEFLAAVDPAGLVGPLVLIARSGVEEVDTFFQNYLGRMLRVGELLEPGFYRISVGP